MKFSTIIRILSIALIGIVGCKSKEPPDARTAKIQTRLTPIVERQSGKNVTDLQLLPEGENGFVGTARLSDNVDYTVKVTMDGSTLDYEMVSKDGSKRISGNDVLMVFSMVAKKDIPAGTLIEDGTAGLALFDSHEKYNMGKEPADVALYNHLGLIKGHRTKNDLKKGQVVKLADIVNADGSPWQPPKIR